MKKTLLSLAIFGSLVSASQAVTAVSNNAGFIGYSPDGGAFFGDLSSSFTTGSDIYELNSVTFDFSFQFGGATPNQFGVTLHSDGGSAPSGLLAALSGANAPAENMSSTYTFTVPFEVAANTKYWFKLSDPGGFGYEPLSASDTSETSSIGWTIGDDIYSSVASGTSGAGVPFAMSIDADVVPEPSSTALLGLSAVGLLLRRRRA